MPLVFKADVTLAYVTQTSLSNRSLRDQIGNPLMHISWSEN
jgi:hypothetical protein